MTRGRLVVIKAVEGIPYYVEGEREPMEMTISGPTKQGRIKLDFVESGEESVEIDLDELIEALIYVDASGAFARKVLDATQGGPG